MPFLLAEPAAALIDSTMRVLFVSANSPSDYVDIEREQRLLQRLFASGNHELHVLPGAEVGDVHDVLASRSAHSPFDVFHFCGHATQKAGLLMRGPGRTHAGLSVTSLKRSLRGRGVRLVLLNACESEPLASSLCDTVPAAIGTTRVLRDLAARHFTNHFYKALLNGVSVKQAFDETLRSRKPGELPYTLSGNDPDVRMAQAEDI